MTLPLRPRQLSTFVPRRDVLRRGCRASSTCCDRCRGGCRLSPSMNTPRNRGSLSACRNTGGQRVEFLARLVAAARVAEAGQVHQVKRRTRLTAPEKVGRVSCRARARAGQFPDERVNQGRLADVGSAHHRDFGRPSLGSPSAPAALVTKSAITFKKNLRLFGLAVLRAFVSP